MQKERNSKLRTKQLFALCILILLCFSSPAFITNSAAASIKEPGYNSSRVYSSAKSKFEGFDSMIEVLKDMDVVFVGELHNDPETHRIEASLLASLYAKRRNLVVSLEMFERDTQQAVDSYLEGKILEEEFLKLSRPWPRYNTDYRPLVEFARAHKLPVLASNAPRHLARKVSSGKGLAELADLPPGEAQWIAAEISAPRDRYWRRFRETMRGHEGASEGDSKAFIYYQAQCLKDDTMAESIARHLQRASSPRPLVVHYNGTFHSDYGEGTALRLRSRVTDANTALVSIIPVKDFDSINPASEAGKGDYIIFCLKEQ